MREKGEMPQPAFKHTQYFDNGCLLDGYGMPIDKEEKEKLVGLKQNSRQADQISQASTKASHRV